MKGKVNLKTLEKELELIFQTPQFVNSEKEKKLLDYLVKKTLAKEYIKEAHIAIDVFNKDGDFDPSLDSTVRVYTGKLRNKLETFYLSEDSKNSTIKISIPKGHYDVKFESRKKSSKLNRLKFITALFLLHWFYLPFLLYTRLMRKTIYSAIQKLLPEILFGKNTQILIYQH